MSGMVQPYRFSVASTSITDSFDRADSASSLGTADTGQAWAALKGTWGISSNKAYTTANTDDNMAALDFGATDMTVTATLSTIGSQPGIIARVTDSNNLYLAQASSTVLQIYKRVSGTFTQLDASAVTAFVAGDTISLAVIGTAITSYKNGVLVKSITDGSLTTGTKAGIRQGGTSTNRWDNFSVT